MEEAATGTDFNAGQLGTGTRRDYVAVKHTFVSGGWEVDAFVYFSKLFAKCCGGSMAHFEII